MNLPLLLSVLYKVTHPIPVWSIFPVHSIWSPSLVQIIKLSHQHQLISSMLSLGYLFVAALSADNHKKSNDASPSSSFAVVASILHNGEFLRISRHTTQQSIEATAILWSRKKLNWSHIIYFLFSVFATHSMPRHSPQTTTTTFRSE